jgi:hypothetical protein
MAEAAKFPIILNQTFIEATRDTGYRSTAAAVAELVDNAVQAKAKNVHIFVREDAGDGTGAPGLAVLDDGSGMDGATLRRALQFGGSMRFGDRSGLGRFGMGLPNASVSQARRLDVFTWRAPNACIASYLDVDDIAAGQVEEIPTVRRSSMPKWAQEYKGFSGTLVTWSKCDRLDNRRVSTIVRKLHEPLGRMFRHFLWPGVKIWVNGELVTAIDPLFLHPSTPLKGAAPFGEPLTFEVRVPGKPAKTAVVTVRFSELPVAQWHDLPVEDKRKYRIVNGAGLSILRAKREVDYGWWFFGAKRRENYDSWWRGELSFDPDLDELFAITHSKQGINPTHELREILTPDLEAVARQLNGRVQASFAAVKHSGPRLQCSTLEEAPQRDRPAPSPRQAEVHPNGNGKPAPPRRPEQGREADADPEYAVSVERLEGEEFFEARAVAGRWCLVLNSGHAFYRQVYEPLRGPAGNSLRRQLERLLLAHAKAEAEKPKARRSGPVPLRASWANQLAELLEGDA